MDTKNQSQNREFRRSDTSSFPSYLNYVFLVTVVKGTVEFPVFSYGLVNSDSIAY